MLIRLTTGASGIAQYLEKGRKRGQEFERDVLDLRVPLFGNLEQVRVAIQSMQPRTPGAAKYLHITLGFAEEHQEGPERGLNGIDLETIRQVEADFRRYFMVAYDASEYQYYAEVHLPKILEQLGEDGIMRKRLPHVHVVIPMRNLVDRTYLNPRGHGLANLRYLDAIQEVINKQYHLKSPKSSRRQDVPGVLARHTGLRHPLERQLSAALKRGELESFDALTTWASGHGEVRIRQGVTGRYINVKLPGARRGINLKAYSEAHFEAGGVESLPDGPKELLDEWLNRTAFEVRYITSNRAVRYKALDREGQEKMLRSFRDETLERIRAVHEQAPGFKEEPPILPRSVPRPLFDKPAQLPRPSHSSLNYSPALITLSKLGRLSTEGIGPDQLKRETQPQLVIEHAVRKYGIDATLYTVKNAADGSPRIVHEGKQYNLGDFFTKHLKTDWSTARAALEHCWRETSRVQARKVEKGLWDVFRVERAAYLQQARVERESVLKSWKAERVEIRRSWQQRVGKRHLDRVGRSEARAIRLVAEIEVRGRALAKLSELRMPLHVKEYRCFLQNRSDRGDRVALHELRKLTSSEEANSSPRIYGRESGKSVFAIPEFRVDERGSVFYSQKTTLAVVDTHSCVRVVQGDPSAYELALRVGIARYGKAMILDGDKQFIAQMVAAAERLRYPVALFRADGPDLIRLAVPMSERAPGWPGRGREEREYLAESIDSPAHRRR